MTAMPLEIRFGAGPPVPPVLVDEHPVAHALARLALAVARTTALLLPLTLGGLIAASMVW